MPEPLDAQIDRLLREAELTESTAEFVRRQARGNPYHMGAVQRSDELLAEADLLRETARRLRYRQAQGVEG